MDYSLPIAKRTRLREALIFKELYERRRKKKKLEEEEEEEEGGNGGSSGGSGLGGSSAESAKLVESSVAACDDGSEEEGVVEIDEGEYEREGVGSVDSAGSKSSGLKNASISRMGVHNFESVEAIEVDDNDDDDDEVEVIAEGCCFDSMYSNCSSLKTGSGMGSKVGPRKKDETHVLPIHVDEVVSPAKRMSDNAGSETELDESGPPDSGLRVSNESKNGTSVVSIDSDDESEQKPSSEEDSDDSEDRDYAVEMEKSFGSANEESSSSSSQEEDEEEEDEAEVAGDSGNNGSIKSNPSSVCVARRTRSHFNSSIKNKKMKHGTFSRPLCVDEEEHHSSSGNENDDDSNGDDMNGDDANEDVLVEKTHRIHRETRGNHGNGGEFVQTVGRRGEGDLGKPAKRKRVRAPKGYDVLKILVDSIWEKGEVLLEDLDPARDVTSSRGEASNEERNPNSPDLDTTLPLKFAFSIQESNSLDKSEHDKEFDQLWTEFEFVLRSSEIGSLDFSMVDTEYDFTPDIKTDSATHCRQGKHQFVLDDEIGIKCKFCSFVTLEIQHIIPTFDTYPWGKSEKKYFGKEAQSILDELQFHDSGHDNRFRCDSSVHAKGTVWDIIPGVRNTMYPHQREGFEFIWKNVAGGIYLDGFKDHTCFDGGSGCIISHAPGTGKTRLTIVFIQTYMELFPTCRPVIIAPCSMLLTWEEEFKKWKVDIPFHNLNKPDFSGKENLAAVNILGKLRHLDRSKNSIRMVKLYSWKKQKSILGVSYRLFEKLVGGRVDKNKKNDVLEAEVAQVRKILLELPGLLVLDEGHTPRNNQSLIWKALSKIETEKRIILSGTPFQNNFGELYNTLCLVRPKFADRFSSEQRGDFRNKRGRKSNFARGKWASLTNSIGKIDGDKLMELRAIIDPFVHVHKGTILQESLPGLRDSVVVLQPAEFQKSLLEGIQGIRNIFELGYFVSLTSVHPSLLPLCCLSEKEESFVDRDKLESLRLNPDAGVKTKFLMELLRLSEAMNEKVLVFSQYIDPLTFIRDQLKSHYSWTEGKEVLYMDGQLDVKQRQSSIGFFNEPTSEVRVLLASIRACSEGISLVGASRVVLLDVVWNPSVERQAISRAYRLGQKKVVHIYHLITSGTIEGEKYCRQAEKGRLSELVFSSTDRDSGTQKISSTVSEDKILEEMVHHDRLKYMFEKIIYQPKESNLIDTFGLDDL